MVIDGPLGPWATEMGERLAELGYAPGSRGNHLALVAKLSSFLEREGLGADDLSPVVLERFCSSVRYRGRSRPTARAFAWLVEFLGDIGVEPPAVPRPTGSELDELVERYRRFLLVERGLASDTVVNYARALTPFLTEHAGRPLDDLDVSDVSRFMTRQCRRLSPAGIERVATSLRSFLGFALMEGLITTPLANAVPSVARWSVAGLPRGLAPAEVKALLASCDRATPTGRRDYAMLVLLVRLGLRAAEVAALRLDDIDWRAGEIVVRGKGHTEERLPLPPDVGAAIADYLQHGRLRRPEREVFLRAVAPIRRLDPQSVSDRVRVAAERAGVGSFGAHRLRHTAGTEMLRGGASLTEVAQVLRHRRMATTAIYAVEGRPPLPAVSRRAVAWGCPMTDYSSAVADYLATRRAMGYKLTEDGRLLRQFVSYLDAVGAEHLSIAHALSWATEPDGSPAWHAVRLGTVRSFARYLSALDPATEVPPVGVLPEPSHRVVPYIYTDDDIARILKEAERLTPEHRADTYRTLIGLIVVTGMRVGEAVWLDNDDVDFEEGILTIRNTKFGKSRQVPLHPTATEELLAYAHRRDQRRPQPKSPSFFTSSIGTRLLRDNVSTVFPRLIKAAGIMSPPGRHRPRLHDARHTFAVRCVIGWYRAGVDVHERLPLLSTYLGHVDPKTTYWYLSGVPELVELIADRLDSVVEERA